MNNYENLINTVLEKRYKLLKIVGTGGMAVVYEAEDMAMNRRVAVKMLKDEINEDEQEVKRFINESRAVAMMSHPNIVHIYDVNVKNSELRYIVMEYIDGITLKDYINGKKRVPWREALIYTEQILSALKHAHEKGVIHRDVKPQNIILLRNGKIKVTDFGIAKITGSESLTMTDKAIGTVHYISPEQASGEGKIDCSSDLYSVGVMLYEMVTGQLPFNGNTAIQVAMMQVNESPQNPRALNPEIPKGLSQIILKAMKKTREERYKTASEMLRHLALLSANPAAVFNINPKNLPVAAGKTIGKNPEVKANDGKQIISQPENKITKEDEMRRRGRRSGGRGKVRKNNRSLLPIISGVTLAFLIVLGISAYNIAFILLKDTGQGENIEIPRYIGWKYDETLLQDLNDKKITLGKPEYVYNAVYAPNEIISQKPDPGDIRKLPVEITFTISKGKDSFELPDLTIMGSREAELLLEEKQVKADIQKRRDDTVISGFVIATEPTAGAVVNAGDTVILYVSEGQNVKMVIMPDLKGKTEKQARQILAAEDIRIKEIRSEYSDIAPGYIIGQDILPTRSVPAKITKVTLTISLGPKAKPTTEPPPTEPADTILPPPTTEMPPFY